MITRLFARSAPMTTVLFVLVLAVVPAGCTEAKQRDQSAPRPVIGFVLSKTTSDFAQEMGQGYRTGADVPGGVDVTVTGPATDDGRKQVEMFQALTGTAKGGIAVAASAPALFARPQGEAVANGLPVVAVGGRPAPGSGVTLLVGNDNFQIGKLLADETIKRIPPNATGKVVVGSTSPTHPGLDQRAAGMMDELTKRLPRTRVMGLFDTQIDEAANLAAWQLLVKANPDAVAFLGTTDIDASHLASIRAQTNGSWFAGGVGGAPTTLQAVKDGQLFATVSPEHFLGSATAGWLMAEHAKGVRPLPQGWLVTPNLMVTSANVDEIIRRQESTPSKLAWAMPHLDKIVNSPDQFLRPLYEAR